jgi:hypothetical protein
MKTKNFIPFIGFFLILIFSFAFCASSYGQTDDVYNGSPAPVDSTKRKKQKDYEWLQKFTYGGNAQLQFGTYTFIYLSPTIGYKLTENLNIGLGAIYNYISINYGGSYGSVSQSVFGGHSFARYFLTQGFFIQAQYDRLRQPNVFSFNPDQKKWVNYAMVGVGFRRPVGDKISLSATFLYNLTPDPLSIYPTRLVAQFGIIGGF